MFRSKFGRFLKLGALGVVVLGAIKSVFHYRKRSSTTESAWPTLAETVKKNARSSDNGDTQEGESADIDDETAVDEEADVEKDSKIDGDNGETYTDSEETSDLTDSEDTQENE